MALTLAAKAPTAVYRYTWAVPVADGDSVVSYTLTESGCTIDADALDGNGVVMVLSGGTAGTTASIAALAITADGEEIPETIYLPIVSSDATGMTARDACEYALRKVYGKDETPEASAMSDAVERLEDMLRMWAATGADVGATFPIVEATVINCRPSFQRAIKENLVIEVADLYNRALSPVTVDAARRGLQHIKSANLPAERAAAEYF